MSIKIKIKKRKQAPEVKKAKEFLKWYKKFLEKNYGKKCKDYCWDCVVCRSWRVYEDFEGFWDNYETVSKYE